MVAVVTVCMYELVRVFFERAFYRRSMRYEFDAFFGTGASDNIRHGVIVLQSDNVEVLAAQLGLALPDGLKSMTGVDATSRVYKARNWINRWDTEGARALAWEFRRRVTDAPELRPVEHKIVDGKPQISRLDVDANAPFEISMGLGFTDETTSEVKSICSPWMYIERHPIYGDVIALNRLLLKEEGGGEKRIETMQSSLSEKHVCLVPPGWDIDLWLKSDQSVKDYAIILRHTRTTGHHRQIFFVLAGFTERGTAAAGHYLATHWKQLHRRLVAGRHDKRSFGDFLLLIGGPSSSPERVAEWREDTRLPPVTGPRIRETIGDIDCEWVRRELGR
jgi:hypothetical protein